MSQARKRELESKLTLEQRKACLLLVANELGDIEDKSRKKKTQEELAKEIGVSRQTLYTWRQDPSFIELKNLYSYDALSGYQDVVFRQLLSLIVGSQPSVKAIDLYMRSQGLLKDRQIVENIDPSARRTNENIEKELEDLDASLADLGIDTE